MSANAHTAGPWRMPESPYENGVYGVDSVDGSKQLVAEVYGYSHDQKMANCRRIVAGNAAIDVCEDIWCTFSDTDDPVLMRIAVAARSVIRTLTDGGHDA